MSAEQASVLVICHVSAAAAATATALQLGLGGPTIDVLCFGRASDDFPPPPGSRFVAPVLDASASRMDDLRLLVALRRRRYKVVALSQPGLGLSRARGLLLAYSYLLAGGHSVIIDPVARRVVRKVGLGLVVADLARWTALQIVARATVSAAVALMGRVSDREKSVRAPGQRGAVVYLRTDVDLRIAPLMAGGSVAHTEGILAALLNRGHDVAYWGTGDVDGIPAGVRRVRLPMLLKGNLPTEVAELVSGVIQGVWGRECRTRGNVPAFIYQRYSLNNLAGVVLARRWGVPLVLEANGSEAKWRQDFGTLKYPELAYACERLILRQADVIAAVSANASEDLVAAGAPAERVRIVPNGVSVELFADATPMPLPGDLSDASSFVVCFVGLFYPWHGVRFLAEAFALFHTRCPDARLLLVGDGEEAPVVRSVLERYGALEAAHFTGLVPRSDAPRYMAAADVLVSPHADVHRFIGSPIKLFEYMAAGKPIVATRVGQIQEVLADAESALLVAPEAPEAMARALERLYDDRAFGERLGRAAQAQARERHSWDTRLAAILNGRPTDASPGVRAAVGESA